jgi:hypothetical protein
MINSSVIETLSKLFKQKPHIQKGGTEILVFCTNCQHHKRKLNINTITGYYQCWVCGFSGKSFSSLLKKLKASAEYYQILCKNKVRTSYVSDEKKTLTLPSEFKPLYKSSNDVGYKHALNYCLKRNLNVHEIVRYNIGYCTEGTFANRVIIPSYDKDGNLNYFTARNFNKNSSVKYKNPDVDPLFDFYCIGNNFRNSDIHAYIGLLDFKRVPLYTSHRKFCGDIFTSLLDQNSFYKVQVKNEDNLFSLPIIAKNKETIDKIKNFCKSKGIEYRPIIGGNLLKQTAFKKYANGDYPHADIINENGLYVGLHYSVTPEQISWFVNTINDI